MQLQLQQQETGAAAAAAVAEQAATAHRGLELLQLLLQFEGPLLLERMQAFYVEEDLLQLNATQAELWPKANGAAPTNPKP